MTAPQLDLAGIPEELTTERAWCVWRYETRGEQRTKVPYRPDGMAWRSNDDKTWATFDEASRAFVRGGFDGIGRRITGDFVGVDIDWKHAASVGEDGPPWLGEFLEKLNSWTEVTPSGRGVHVWLRGTWPSTLHSVKLDPPGCGVEVYDASSARFFTLTGVQHEGSADVIRSGGDTEAVLAELSRRLEQLNGGGRASKAVDKGAELQGAPQGQRRAVLTSEAGRLRVLGVSKAEARAVLLAVAAKCVPPVPPEHVEEILTWAWRKPAGEPRRCPVCERPEPCAEHPPVPPGRGRSAASGDDELTAPLWTFALAAHDALQRWSEGDTSAYVPTGISTLDRRLNGGFERGEVSLLGGPTGGGKTAALGVFAHNAARAGNVALLVSPEMTPEQLATREIVRRSGCPKWARNPFALAANRHVAAIRHAAAAEELAQERLPLEVVRRNVAIAGMQVVATAARQVKARHGRLDLVLLDYAQQITTDDARTPRYRSVWDVALASQALARELGCAVLLAAQTAPANERNGESDPQFYESKGMEKVAVAVLHFVTEWTKPDRHGRRAVEKATFRCTKLRDGALFVLPVEYRPELFRICDESSSDEAGKGAVQ